MESLHLVRSAILANCSVDIFDPTIICNTASNSSREIFSSPSKSYILNAKRSLSSPNSGIRRKSSRPNVPLSPLSKLVKRLYKRSICDALTTVVNIPLLADFSFKNNINAFFDALPRLVVPGIIFTLYLYDCIAEYGPQTAIISHEYLFAIALHNLLIVFDEFLGQLIQPNQIPLLTNLNLFQNNMIRIFERTELRLFRICLRSFIVKPDGDGFFGQSYSVKCKRIPDSKISICFKCSSSIVLSFDGCENRIKNVLLSISYT
ncbi:hypothetical protein DERP_002423 [Dermatophagoides pteronyssinus]|uniref:Uncharacterized protein n=1 Tax=Dermatophagoides pteronyssinus TaxID=6956 RepID=A0ABQ8JHS8_DERPT|nr:hypothetical protein DERP_002423 [Dermatophagoides pteronyssinus]